MRRTASLAAALVLVATACSSDLAVTSRSTDAPRAGASSVETTTPTTSDPPSTTTTTTTTTVPVTTTAAVSTTVAEPAPAWYPQLGAAAAALSIGNGAVSVSVRRVGVQPYDVAIGNRNDGGLAVPSTPFVLASVGKLFTAVAVARLVAEGRIAASDRVPWSAMGLPRDPVWDTVTVRELLDHTSGMPVNQRSWLDEPATCEEPLEQAMAAPPTSSRGTWRYSNGNYCALGLLVEHLTGRPMGEAVDELVLGPAGVAVPDEAYLARDGEQPTAAPYPKGVRRLLGLGGAGEWLASAPATAAVVAAITPADRVVLGFPGLMVDQYGWGHTGTVDGAKTCAWVIDSGRTVVVALVAGGRPGTGGAVCDRLVPALAADLGLPPLGDPVRLPR
jgi:CubicO group peptidase (beta-lactamase class C family)